MGGRGGRWSRKQATQTASRSFRVTAVVHFKRQQTADSSVGLPAMSKHPLAMRDPRGHPAEASSDTRARKPILSCMCVKSFASRPWRRRQRLGKEGAQGRKKATRLRLENQHNIASDTTTTDVVEHGTFMHSCSGVATMRDVIAGVVKYRRGRVVLHTFCTCARCGVHCISDCSSKSCKSKGLLPSYLCATPIQYTVKAE